MSFSHPRDPLHGITLKTFIKELVERSVWAERGLRVPIRCFLHDPSVKSSLTVLRKTPGAGGESKGGTSLIKICEQRCRLYPPGSFGIKELQLYGLKRRHF